MATRRLLGAALAIVALSSSAAARDIRQDRARVLFESGRAAYAREDFQGAYEFFRQAYLVSAEPALLYNMSSALALAGKPHEAAEALRAYLRALPDDPERRAIEQRIRSLEEAQRMLDSGPSPPRAA